MKFEAAQMEWQQGLIDVWTAASTQGLSANGETAEGTAVVRMTEAPIAAMRQTVAAVLGEDGYKAYLQYDESHTARDFVASLAGSVYFSEAPLTAAQGDALMTILQTNTKTVDQQMADDGKRQVFRKVEVTDWEAVQSQAQGVLASPQLTALRSLAMQAKSEAEIFQILNPLPAVKGKVPGG